jgi:hypothetical protein
MKQLPSPELVSSYFHDGFTPLLGAMCLRWPEELDVTRSVPWHLPENVRLIDTLPERFGVRILRTGDDGYDVCLLWNRVSLRWTEVRRDDLLHSSLQPVLASLGTDLAHLLDQPVLEPLKLAA